MRYWIDSIQFPKFKLNFSIYILIGNRHEHDFSIFQFLIDNRMGNKIEIILVCSHHICISISPNKKKNVKQLIPFGLCWALFLYDSLIVRKIVETFLNRIQIKSN